MGMGMYIQYPVWVCLEEEVHGSRDSWADFEKDDGMA